MEIQYSKQALKFLKKQDVPTRKRIINAINLLPAGDVKALQGRNDYRLRVGDYRIIFDINGNILLIEAIGNRGQIYKECDYYDSNKGTYHRCCIPYER